MGTIKNKLTYLNETKQKIKDVINYSISALPSGYTQVDYIESSGTQYINTNYKLQSSQLEINTKIYINTLPVSSEQDIVSNQDNTTNRFIFGVYESYFFGYSRGSIGNMDSHVTSANLITPNIFEITLKYDYLNKIKMLTVNGITTTAVENQPIAPSNNNITIFKNAIGTYYFIGRIYNMSIKDKNILVRDFIPCIRDNDNEIGLYDLVNNVFYTNQGTGVFTYGKKINITTNTPFRQYPDKLYNQYIEILKDKNVLLDSIPKKEVSGNNILLNDAADLPVYDLKMDKESTQNNTTGKNLFNKLDYSTINLIANASPTNVIKTQNSISFTSSGSNYSGVYMPKADFQSYIDNFDADTYYYVSADITTNTSCVFGFGQADSNDQLSVGTQRLVRYTKINFAFVLYVKSAVVANIKIENIMVSTSSDTSYEPYTGGQPSPNSDYPQEIKTVKGYSNLFDKDNVEILSRYVNNNGTIKNGVIGSSGHTEKSFILQVKPNTTYTITKLITSNSRIAENNNANFELEQSYNLLSNSPSDNTKITITTSSTTNYLFIYFINNANETYTVDEVINSIMIVEGDQKLPYVSYGNNYVNVKVTGKNLFNSTITQNSSIRLGGGTLEVKPNTTYVFSSSNNNIQIVNYYKDKDERVISNTNWSNMPYTFTTPANCYYISPLFRNADDSNISVSDATNMMLEQNSVASSYESYKESNISIPLNGNELVGIGEYLDELKVDKSGHVFINKKTGKTVLNGSEEWEIGESGFFLRSTTLIFDKRKLDVYDGFCNNFIFNKNSTTWTNKNYCGFSSTNNFWIREDGEIASTINDFQTWLSTHNTEVYYILETPEPINLQTKVDIELFKGVNNISNSEDGNIILQYVPNKIE